MSSNKKVLDDILGEIKSLKKLQKEYNGKVDMLMEVINHMHAKVADISCKIDLNSSSLNTQISIKPSIKKGKPILSTVDIKKPKLNIMSYFKLKYKEDRESLKDIISDKELDELFERFEDELKTKKKSNLESAKLALVYKELIRGNDLKQKMLRNMKEKEEEEEAEKLQKEILENEIQDDDVEYEEVEVDEEEDDDVEYEEVEVDEEEDD